MMRNRSFLLSVADALPALLAGNAVIVKPSELTPLSAVEGRELLVQSGLDPDLFGTPFAALVSGGEPNAPVYLIERHSVRIVSGAALWSGGQRRDPPAGGFVGVGDAVYNTADARWRGPSPGFGPGRPAVRRPTSWASAGWPGVAPR